MKIFSTLAVTLCFAGALCYAETFTGKLMDASCYTTNKVSSQESGRKTYDSITKTCAPTASTTNFALRVNGSTYNTDAGNTFKLDDAANAQAATAIQNGTLKPDKDGDVHAKVSGKVEGETLVNATVQPEHGK